MEPNLEAERLAIATMRRQARCNDCHGTGQLRVLYKGRWGNEECGCRRGGHGDPVKARMAGSGTRKKKARKKTNGERQRRDR